MRIFVLGTFVLSLVACTAIDVRPAQNLSSSTPVCIINNPAVIVDDFVDVVRDGFNRHGIPTSVVDQSDAKTCEVTLTYTALRSWDLAPYLSHAELRLWRNGAQVGFAQYHLKGKGGYSLAKWKGTKSKMDPVVDQLLGGVQ